MSDCPFAGQASNGTLPSSHPPVSSLPRVQNTDWSSQQNTIALHALEPLTPSSEPSRHSGGTSGVLDEERRAASFNVTTMTNYLDGGVKATGRRKFILSPTKNMQMKDKYSMTRDELIRHHLAHFTCVHEPYAESYVPTREEVGWMQENTMNSGSMMNHWGLFVPTLLMQGSDEQKAEWLSRAMMGEIVGCYAQTELGHGSNVRGLRTTATFDPESKCFEVDTPELSATKWWPGGMGKVATHAVVYAQLILDGREQGVQAFIIQIRDEKHRPLPGIEVGDLGNKLGDAANDTGFLRFHKVKVPLNQMLSKFQRVTENGQFVRSKQPSENTGGDKVAYATMAFSRGAMVRQSGGMLARAVTIAIRYSAIRRQGFRYPSTVKCHRDEELKIIDHQVQRIRLFRQLAAAYALKFAGKHVLTLFSQLEGGSVAGGLADLSSLAETAATSAGLKALCCVMAADGIEDCRKCCGGNGYLLASGIAALAVDYVWQTTAEGDTIVLLLQTARFVLKQLSLARAGEQLKGPLSYLTVLTRYSIGLYNSCDLALDIEQSWKAGKDSTDCTYETEWERLLDSMVRAIDVYAIAEFASAEAELENSKSYFLAQAKAKSEEDKNRAHDLAWAHNNVILCSASTWHCLGFTLKAFVSAVHDCTDESCRRVLAKLALLFATNTLLDNPISIGGLAILNNLKLNLASQEVSGIEEENRLNIVRSQFPTVELVSTEETKVQLSGRSSHFLSVVSRIRLQLLDELRPDSVALVDAFDYPDRVLNSAIGSYDGNIYESLMESARRSPLNRSDPFWGYEETIRRKLDLELLAEGRQYAETMQARDIGAKLRSQL